MCFMQKYAKIDKMSEINKPYEVEPRFHHEVHDEQEPNMLEGLEVSIDELHGLSPEEQVGVIEDIAYDVLDRSPEGIMTKKLLEKARDRGNQEEADHIVAKRRNLFESHKQEAAFMFGVELEDPDAEKKTYQEALQERIGELQFDELSDAEIMQQLGFITIDDNGNERFSFPKDVFPPYIVDKWDQYSDSVQNHIRAFESLKRGVSNDQKKVMEWDRVRRIMHDGVADAVRDFLGLDWDNERSRKFITKMLEKRIPTKDTRESMMATSAIMSALSREEAYLEGIKNHGKEEEE